MASRRQRKIPAFQATASGPARSAAAASAGGFSTNRRTAWAPASAREPAATTYP